MEPNGMESRLRHTIIGRFLRTKRLEADLTQADVADYLRYSTAQFISNWERGLSLPPLDTLPKLAELFHINGREIVGAMMKYEEKMLALRKKQMLDIFRDARH